MGNHHTNFELNNFLIDLERYEYECHYNQNMYSNPYLSKIKVMATEIIVSAIIDILSIDKIKECINVLLDNNAEYYKKITSQIMLSNHVDSVNWFSSGEALESIWFEILGINFIKKKFIMNMVHERIEGRFKQVERRFS